MWTLIYSPQYGYGVLQVVGNTTPYVLRAGGPKGVFFVKSLAELTIVTPDSSSETYSEWITTVNGTVLYQFTTDDPLKYLKDHYPEHYL